MTGLECGAWKDKQWPSHKEFFNDLANALEQLEPGDDFEFDMARYYLSMFSLTKQCKTVGCIAGWFKFLKGSDDLSVWALATELDNFGIKDTDPLSPIATIIDAITCPEVAMSIKDITKKHATNALRRFAELEVEQFSSTAVTMIWKEVLNK